MGVFPFTRSVPVALDFEHLGADNLLPKPGREIQHPGHDARVSAKALLCKLCCLTQHLLELIPVDQHACVGVLPARSARGWSGGAPRYGSVNLAQSSLLPPPPVYAGWVTNCPGRTPVWVSNKRQCNPWVPRCVGSIGQVSTGVRHKTTHHCEQLANQSKKAETMTPKVRTRVVHIPQWSRVNILRHRRAALHLQNAVDEMPAELGKLD